MTAQCPVSKTEVYILTSHCKYFETQIQLFKSALIKQHLPASAVPSLAAASPALSAKVVSKYIYISYRLTFSSTSNITRVLRGANEDDSKVGHQKDRKTRVRQSQHTHL